MDSESGRGEADAIKCSPCNYGANPKRVEEVPVGTPNASRNVNDLFYLTRRHRCSTD